MNASLIKLQNVWAGYDGRDVLRDVSMEVESADFVGVTGPNGGGKTTLVKLLVGLVEPSRGTIERATEKIGYLPQQNLFDRKFPITVDEVVVSGLQNRGGKFTREDFDAARNLLTINGIPELARRQIGELSGGQLQRVLLCRALISEPELLVLDEPATFIDQKSEQELYETLVRLNEGRFDEGRPGKLGDPSGDERLGGGRRDKKMAIVMVSHDASALKKIASRMIEIG